MIWATWAPFTLRHSHMFTFPCSHHCLPPQAKSGHSLLPSSSSCRSRCIPSDGGWSFGGLRPQKGPKPLATAPILWSSTGAAFENKMLLWLMNIKQQCNTVILKVVRGSQEQPTSRALSALPKVYLRGSFMANPVLLGASFIYYQKIILLRTEKVFSFHLKLAFYCFQIIILFGLRCIPINTVIGPINILVEPIYRLGSLLV